MLSFANMQNSCVELDIGHQKLNVGDYIPLAGIDRKAK